HRGQRADAALESFGELLALVGETELAVLACGVTVLAPVLIEHILRHFLLVFACGAHFVERSNGDLRILLLLGKEAEDENWRGEGHPESSHRSILRYCGQHDPANAVLYIISGCVRQRFESDFRWFCA